MGIGRTIWTSALQEKSQIKYTTRCIVLLFLPLKFHDSCSQFIEDVLFLHVEEKLFPRDYIKKGSNSSRILSMSLQLMLSLVIVLVASDSQGPYRKLDLFLNCFNRARNVFFIFQTSPPIGSTSSLSWIPALVISSADGMTLARKLVRSVPCQR